MAKLYIGTSGWVYPHWEGVFYPPDLKSKDKLKYFSKNFKTVEINYSFYHLPRPVTYQKWCSETPANFIFSIKASRFITHIKRLKGVKNAWRTFLENALYLKEKLGPILFQFPPSFSADNVKRLEEFLRLITKDLKSKNCNLKCAFEFRHKSWFTPLDNENIYNLLKKHNIALVIADSPRYPRVDIVTAKFVYIRLHGSKILFSSKYTSRELKVLSQKIKKWLKQKLDVYCYFNNDAYGYAIENAKTLKRFLKD